MNLPRDIFTLVIILFIFALTGCSTPTSVTPPAPPQNQNPVASRASDGIWTWFDKEEYGRACTNAKLNWATAAAVTKVMPQSKKK